MTHPVVLVFLGGGIGSVARYVAGKLIPASFNGTVFPVGILTVNIIASAILGWVVSWLLTRSTGDEARLLIGVGFCGGLSTFSSFSYDTVVLLQTGRWGAAFLNIALNIILCLAATAGGFWLAGR